MDSRHGRTVIAFIAVATLLTLAGCTPASNGSDPSSAADNSACGTVPTVAPNDPENVLAKLPEQAREYANGYQDIPILPSAWESYAGTTEQIKVAAVASALAAPWQVNVLSELTSQFDQAKAKGTVQGDLEIRQPADASTQTPADSLRLYQDLVGEGYNLIFVNAISGDAMVDAVDEAGKKGVVTVTFATPIPSAYAINVVPNSYLMAAIPFAAGADLIGKKGNLLQVQGVQGYTVTDIYSKAMDSLLATCPDIKSVGTVYGGFSSSVAKSEIVSFLASNPAPVDAVIQLTVMGSGVWSAFADSGRPIPVIMDVAASAGSLAYWKKAIPNGYKGVGSASAGSDSGEILWRAAMRVFAGDGPRTSVMPYILPDITNDNLDQFVVPDEDTSSGADILVPTSSFPNEEMNVYFTK